jgi:hypothetical protein
MIMIMRVLLAATVFAGLAVPAAFAKQRAEPQAAKRNTQKPFQMRNKADRARIAPGNTNKADPSIGGPYST